MTRERPPIQVPATPEYLLAYFRELNRAAVSIGDAEPGFELAPETTLGDWSRKSDLGPDRPFIRSMERHRGLARRPWAEWKAMLKPRAGRTVAEFCERLAALGATRPAFEPIGFLGAKPCAAAGAFAAVRSILRDRGADADAISPSTPLEPYLRRYLGTFCYGPLFEAAPGALPDVRITRLCLPLKVFSILCVLAVPAAFLAILAAVRVDWLALRVGWLLAAFPIAILGLLAARFLEGRFELTRYELGDLRTFKDLARALAAGEPARAV